MRARLVVDLQLEVEASGPEEVRVLARDLAEWLTHPDDGLVEHFGPDLARGAEVAEAATRVLTDEDEMLAEGFTDGWIRVIELPDPTCESCGEPATVTLEDGSTWCSACDAAARRMGYDDLPAIAGKVRRRWMGRE